MSDRPISPTYLVGPPVDDRPIPVDGEGEVTRIGTGLTFPSITLENPFVVTDFEGDESYCETRISLVII